MSIHTCVCTCHTSEQTSLLHLRQLLQALSVGLHTQINVCCPFPSLFPPPSPTPSPTPSPHQNLEACGIGRLLEVFPDNLSTGTDTCYAVVKHDDGRSCGSADATSQAFLSLQPKQPCTVKLVRIDFSSLRPEYKGAKSTNKEVSSGTSDARSGVFASVEREEVELPPGGDRLEDLTLGMSELQLSRLVIPPPAVRCTWNPVPELMETARAGLVGGGPKEKASHIDLGSLWEDGSSRAVDWTEMVTAREKMRERMEGQRKGWVEEAVRGGGTTVGDERRIHRREERVASAGGHGGGSLSAEKAVSQSGQYPSVDNAGSCVLFACSCVRDYILHSVSSTGSGSEETLSTCCSCMCCSRS